MIVDINKITNILDIVKARDSFELTDPNWHVAEARIRELLAIKYKDEAALSIKNTFVPTYIKPGLVTAKEIEQFSSVNSMDLVHELSRIAEFVPRSYCEYNPLYKQIIPYTIGITADRKIFTMERIAGDARLIGKISIGIGGHINTIDADDPSKVIETGLGREIEEEVFVNLKDSYLTFEGFLYDPSDNVGLDHIGLVCFLHLSNNDISIKELDKHKGYLSTVEELGTKVSQMENWTRIVYDNLIK